MVLSSPFSSSLRSSAGLMLLRLFVGAVFVMHGWPKIQNPTSWMPGGNFPGYLQAAAAVAEFGGGAALILGLLTPLAALGLAVTMAVAVFVVHVPMGHPLVATESGGPSYELAAAYLVSALALLLLGPGRFSLDALLLCSCCGTKCSSAKEKAASAA